MNERIKFDPEYKQMVVELSEARGNNLAFAAEMDLQPELIYRWRREAMAHPVPASRVRQQNNLSRVD